MSHVASAPEYQKAPLPSYQDLLQDRLSNFIRTHNISERYQGYLNKLLGKHLVFIIDDSTSMNYKPYVNAPSEWQKLKKTLSVLVEVALIYDEQGADFHFLNRGQILNVVSESQILPAFNKNACGGTPTPRVLNELYNKYRNSEVNPLFIVFTDGHPNDEYGDFEKGKQQMIDFMSRRHFDKKSEKMPISFVMCTREESIVEYYDSFTENYLFTTITEHYEEEKKEMNDRFRNMTFSEGDWILKIVLGAFVKEIGNMDQPVSMPAKGCCAIL